MANITQFIHGVSRIVVEKPHTLPESKAAAGGIDIFHDDGSITTINLFALTEDALRFVSEEEYEKMKAETQERRSG